jgi:hypothetical protein
MTDPTPTEWRALCAELLESLENAIRVVYNEDGTKHISTADPVIAKADAALSQPEPQGPTDQELHQLWQELYIFHDGPTSGDVAEIARAVLDRWGRPTIESVPVAERLPGPEDCDAEGMCWWWACYDEEWVLDAPPRHVPAWTHWLPHHTLPVPQQQEAE